VEHPEKSYICTNNQPIPLHEVIQWFQRQLNLPELIVASPKETGKRIFATRMRESGFQLEHEDCFSDYAELLKTE
jgi:hypothetical protein